MDPLIDRFHRLLRSMFQTPDGAYDFRTRDDDFEDRDYQDAWEELEAFLGGGTETPGRERRRQEERRRSLPPEELRSDYSLLEVAFGAPFEEVKESHRRLVKKHHPDRHAHDEELMRKATETTQRLNYSFGRIRAWDMASSGRG